MTDEEMVNGSEDVDELARLRHIMHRLRAPGGCAWDAKQTHESLTPHLIEEAYETIDTIKRKDYEHLKEELGDLLLQVVFHCEIAEESERFNLDEVARDICEKLIRRHPHVFSNKENMSSEKVLEQWDEIKNLEKGDEKKPYLHRVGKGLPSMLRALKLQKKASKVGFDWQDNQGCFDKIKEELDELSDEMKKGNSPALTEEMGDLLFSVINLMRRYKLNPEIVLENTNTKFENRFTKMEQTLEVQGKNLKSASLEEMESRWQAVK